MNDAYIYKVPLPSKIPGVTVFLPDCTVIFINAYLTPEIQKRAISHELNHYKFDHAYDLRSVARLEEEAG